MTHPEDNPAITPQAARDWISMIESERGRIREADVYPRLRAWFNDAASPNVLDIGCGQGICSEYIKPGPARYTGLERSSMLARRAHQLYAGPQRRFVLGNAYDLPFGGASFGAAFSINLWHLLDNVNRAASELSRVLRLGGHFLIITANPDAYDLWTKPYTDVQRRGPRFEGNVRLQDQTLTREVLYLHPGSALQQGLSQAALEVQHTETFRECRDSAPLRQYLLIRGRKPSG